MLSNCHIIELAMHIGDIKLRQRGSPPAFRAAFIVQAENYLRREVVYLVFDGMEPIHIPLVGLPTVTSGTSPHNFTTRDPRHCKLNYTIELPGLALRLYFILIDSMIN